MRSQYLALALGACVLSACKPQPISQADETALRGMTTAFNAAANAGNADALTALFTSDAVVQPNGMPEASGAAAIRKLWTDMMAPMTPVLRSSVTRVSGEGNLAWITGTYHVEWKMKDATKAPPPPEDGKFIGVAVRQADNTWKWASDTWNPNTMPAAPAPAPAGRRH